LSHLVLCSFSAEISLQSKRKEVFFSEIFASRPETSRDTKDAPIPATVAITRKTPHFCGVLVIRNRLELSTHFQNISIDSRLLYYILWVMARGCDRMTQGVR
jgi:hypothetical protein